MKINLVVIIYSEKIYVNTHISSNIKISKLF